MDKDEIVDLCKKSKEWNLGLHIHYKLNSLEHTARLDPGAVCNNGFLLGEEETKIPTSAILSIELIEMPDIAAELAALYEEDQPLHQMVFTDADIEEMLAE